MEKSIIEYISKLARLDLDNRELDLLSSDMTSIIELMDTIKDINMNDLNDINLGNSNLDNNFSDIDKSKCNSLRNDEPLAPMETDFILKNATLKLENSFVVPKVVD